MTHSSEAQTLEARYERQQQRISVIDSPHYAKLVVPNGNHALPLHRWFHLKEAYSSLLVARVLRDTGLDRREGLRVLDPFAGVGTTCISVGDLVARSDLAAATVYGIETNGFLHLVGATKLATLQQAPQRFNKFAVGVGRKALAMKDEPPAPPALSTFHNSGYFEKADVAQLMRIRVAIEDAEALGADPLDVGLARVCLGAIVEPVSNLRRDGRALRLAEKSERPATLEAFLEKASDVHADRPGRRVPVGGGIMRGDGRLMSGIDGRFRPFDLILFSPPYPNNIDYTEVYKLENWLLGYISNQESFANQRRQTVYSHPSILRPEPLPSGLLSNDENAAVARSVEQLRKAVPADRYSNARRRMLSGYALDMYLTLRSAGERLADDGWIVYIVGNSVHGNGPAQLIIAADLLIAELGTIAGLTVDRLEIARHLARRSVTSPFLRESVVFLRKAA